MTKNGNESDSLEIVLRVAFFTFKNMSTALFTVQKIDSLLVKNIKLIIFSKILFFSQVLWFPDS